MNRIIRVGICSFLLCVCCVSCFKAKKGEACKDVCANSVELSAEEILIPLSDELLLKSYYLSSSFHDDSTEVVVGYNYKEHTLDIIDLNSKKTSQIKLNQEGPAAITKRVGGICVHNLDSIWICDDTQNAFLINGKGEVKEKILLSGDSADEVVAVSANYAMSVIKLFYNEQRNSLFYAVGKIEDEARIVTVKELSLGGQRSIESYVLSPSTVEPIIKSKDYGYLCHPNVVFTNDKIIYNYPIESSVYIIDLPTMERRTVIADSEFTSNRVPKSSASSYEEREENDLENVHFHEVMYMPRQGLFCRLHVGAADMENEKDRMKWNDTRKLFLTLFDRDLNRINELELPSCRYSYYTGWCALNGGILIFVDNLLSKSDMLEELIFDVYKPL